MSVERGNVTTTAKLYIEREPGFTYDASVDLELAYSGQMGVRALNNLIEEATKLRDELKAQLG